VYFLIDGLILLSVISTSFVAVCVLIKKDIHINTKHFKFNLENEKSK